MTSVADTVSSDRLHLIPMPAEFLRASLAGDRSRAEKLIGLTIPDDWPDQPDLVRRRLDALQSAPQLQPWLLRAIALQHTRAMVGHIGFHTDPGPEYLRDLSPGGIEYGYTVFPQFRRQGYAREACEALMTWARCTHGVTRFVVSISPTNVASMTLASRLGFCRIGAHVDEVDGPEEILERRFDSES